MRAGGITPDADSRAVNVVIRRLRAHPAHGKLHVAQLRREDVFGRQPVRAGNGNITAPGEILGNRRQRSEEHTSELQSLMRISYAVFCLKKKKQHTKRQIKSRSTKY